ncbi:GspH/FimT family pseudopilin [Pseudoxanthomonas gei]|nr:GspH/FimT family pseudopilin [Pseudoxanthomonas gei]
MKGFTLLELMVTIAIAAILLTIALPSFQASLRSNQVATTTNEFLGAISLARSEAIRGTQSAGVCASADGATCGADWNLGWLVWTDVGNVGLGTLEATDTIVRYSQGRSKMAINAGGVGAFVFDNRGRMSARNGTGGAMGGNQAVVMQSYVCPAGSNLVRTMNVNMTGQVTMERSDCP